MAGGYKSLMAIWLGGMSAVPVQPAPGQIGLTGRAPVVSVTATLGVKSPLAFWLGGAASEGTDVPIVVRPAAYYSYFGGLVPVVENDVGVKPPLGSAALTGMIPVPNTGANVSVAPSPVAAELTGIAPTVKTTLVVPMGINLAWDANSDSDLAGYYVYYGTSSGVYGAPIDVGNVTNYAVTGLAPGTVYFFAVKAYDSETPRNFSAYSSEVSAALPVKITGLSPTVTVTTGVHIDVSPSPINLTGKAVKIKDGIKPPAGSLTVTGKAVKLRDSIKPYSIQLSFTGIQPVDVIYSNDRTITVPVRYLNTVGQVCLLKDRILGTAVAMTLTGKVPVVSSTDKQVVAPAAQALALTGVEPTATVTTNIGVMPPVGSMALAGLQVYTSQLAVPAAGSLAITGKVPTAGTVVPEMKLKRSDFHGKRSHRNLP